MGTVDPSIDAYIRGFPASTQKLLNQIRSTIRKAAPGASEKISYGIPTFFLNENLVHFAGYDKHIGFYPGGAGIEVFADELAAFETSKGTVRFPIDRPLPLRLVTKIVRFRVSQAAQKASAKKPTPAPFPSLAAPAERALKKAGITTIKQLARFSEGDIKAMHGIGPNAMTRLKQAMRAAGVTFQKTVSKRR